MIHLTRWDPAARTLQMIPLTELPSNIAEIAGEVVYWIDLENPTPEEEERVFKQFLPVHPLTLEDVTKPRREPERGSHLPKVEEFPDYLFVVVNPLPEEVCAASGSLKLRNLHRPQLSAVLNHQVLITHHYPPLTSVVQIRDYALRHGECARRGPDYLFHLILDAMVDEYAPVVERLSDRLDSLEIRLFRDPSPKLLSQLVRLKRHVSFLRKTLILEREVLARLVRGEFQLVSAPEIAYYRNVYDHLVRYTELVEAAREMVSDLLQTHLAATGNKLNQVMKVLTMISTVVLPMSLIAGIYGMNFKFMPELEWEMGYPFAIVWMAITAVFAFTIFRWRKWI